MKNIFKRKDDIVSREIAGEHILVPIRGRLADMQRIFSVDSTAEYIWQTLDGKKTLTDILTDVLNTFDADKERAETDLLEFIHELLAADLIRKVK